MLKGISVILHERMATGTDEFGKTQYEYVPVTVSNVLVAPGNLTDYATSTNFEGKKYVYTLGIPKGDNHNWEDSKVEFFGKMHIAAGPIIEGIEDNVPTKWHKKIVVERYE